MQTRFTNLFPSRQNACLLLLRWGEHTVHKDNDCPRAIFLGWLKRNGGAKHLTTCQRKLRHLGLDLNSFIGDWSPDKISIMHSRGERVLWLRDIRWADEYAIAHDVEVPHHAQFQKKS
jgi:hypothetical protein